MKSKYDSVVRILPETEHRDEVVFRVAGDGFLEVAYGKEKAAPQLEEILLRIFRVLVIDKEVKDAKLEGVLETIPGGRSNLYKFDLEKISMEKLVDEISAIEKGVESLRDSKITTRLIRLPLIFNGREVRMAIEKYLKEIKPNSVNCENGSNLSYLARYNGITVEEVKQKFLKTRWLVAMVGFFTGGEPFYFPLDPTCALVAPKYNPSRTWTSEGVVDLAGFCSTIYCSEGGGGYQLIGRTAPVFQGSQKHPQFRESRALLRSTDILQYYEISEKELDEIYRLVHEEGRWDYDIKEESFCMKDWLNFCDQVKEETEDFRQKQENGRKVTPLP